MTVGEQLRSGLLAAFLKGEEIDNLIYYAGTLPLRLSSRGSDIINAAIDARLEMMRAQEAINELNARQRIKRRDLDADGLSKECKKFEMIYRKAVIEQQKAGMELLLFCENPNQKAKRAAVRKSGDRHQTMYQRANKRRTRKLDN